MKDNKILCLIKAIIIFIIYILNTTIFNKIFELIGISNNIISMFVADIFFLILIILILIIVLILL